ncbi:hypothetical protein [Planktotalea arctica]|uniref:hypothetical protein n=1 Tax=Planktotalea arctica TaxID=1481893 RepID=UPI000A176901|nr:hypothetical protein [Planktotalea arctica]
MLKSLLTFTSDENGAVTVDWVVLTAAIVGLSVAAYATISAGTGNLTGNTTTTLSGMNVGNVTIAE